MLMIGGQSRLFPIAVSFRWPTQMHVVQGIIAWNKSDEVWKRDRGATVRFLDDRPKKAKGVGEELDRNGHEREGEIETDEKEKKQAGKSFPLVERNTHRFATIQRFALALHCKAARLCNALLLLLNRALDRCRRTIKIASSTCQRYRASDLLFVSVV